MSVTDAKRTPPDFCPCCGSPRVATKGGEVRYDCNSTLKRRGVWCYRRAEGRWHVERQEMIEVLKQVDVVMDGAALMGVGDVLGPQYREEWARVHTAVREVLARVRGEAS